jgi:LmbE family N-acetylglucosaminyl deacetylase
VILAVVAHSDDESFWMGGTLAMLSERDKVTVAALSDGVGSRFPEIDCAYDKARQRRHRAFLRACGLLKAECVQLDTFPDQGADTVGQLEINRSVMALVDDYQPTTVYTHHPGDLNVDHRRTAEAVFVAMRGRDCALYTMRPEWPHLCVGQTWKPTTRHILTERAMATKLEACACYVDEMRETPHPRSRYALMCDQAESFMAIQ